MINYDIICTNKWNFDNIMNKYKRHWRSKHLEIGTLQQTVSGIIGNWRSYTRALACYNNIHVRYYGPKPYPPSLKRSGSKSEIIVVRNAIRIRENMFFITLSPEATAKITYEQIWGKNYFSKSALISEITDGLRQVRFRWNKMKSRWSLVLIYEQTVPDPIISNKNVMAIDIGLNNLCALTFRFGCKTFLINGRPLKSVNRFLNHKIDLEQSRSMKLTGSSQKYSDSETTKKIRVRLNSYISNYLHSVSKICIEVAILEKCRIIVIGDLKGIKKGHTNRSFVQIPLMRLVEMIKYKAEKNGIKVILINEAYTSISSSLDLEEIKYVHGRKNRRIHRGAFVSEKGLFINSDINGSLNILRLFLNQVYEKRLKARRAGLSASLDGSIPELISFIRDKGYVVNPKMINIFR